MKNQLSTITLSIEIACIAGCIAIVLGTLCGYLMNKYQFKGKFFLELLFLLPIVLPPSVVGFILLILLGKNSVISPIIEFIFQSPIIFTKYAAIIAASVVAFPLMYQAAKSGFSQVDNEIEDAARVDGASEKKVFLKVTLPMAIQVLVGGAILSIARAFGEFGATLMVAGNIPGKTQTIPTAIYMAMSMNDRGTAWYYVIIMIFISSSFLILLELTKNKNK